MQQPAYGQPSPYGQPGGFAPQPSFGYGQQPGFGAQPGFGPQFAPGQPVPGFGFPGNFGQMVSGVGQFVQSAVPAARQFAGAFDQFGHMFNALQQGQIPPLPAPSPQQPGSYGTPQAGPFGFDATALLRMMMGNPQFQQALQSAAVMGQSGARTIGLPVPQPGGARTVQVPLGAAVNTVRELAERALSELNASTREDEPEVPEYLLSEEGDFLVDPASSDERAALVAHLFSMNDAAMRRQQPLDLDEADAWARDAGFFGTPALSE